MTEDYAEEDKIKFLLNDYSNWLTTTSISQYFNEDLNSNRTINLNEINPNNYLIKVIIMLKDNFLKHCV